MADIHISSINDVAPWANILVSGDKILTADDLARLPEDDHLYELVEGRLVQMPPPKPRHGRIAGAIYRLISNFVVQYSLGTTYAAETGFLVRRNPDTVLAPDVAFVRTEQLVGVNEEEYFPFAPDLAVEVASSGQTPKAMATKARQWLNSGARLVWIVYPETQQVEIWRPGIATHTLSVTDTLDGADVLVGFTCQISDFFERLLMPEMPTLDLPPAFVQAITTMHGERGRAWLAGLPVTLAVCAEQWDLRLDPHFANLSYHFVAPGVRRSDGQPVVVKICAPTGEFGLEAAALRHFAGQGMAALLAEDPAREVLLLERLVPGTPLRLMVDDVEATHIAADVMRALWCPPPATPAFPSVADWHQGFARLHAHYPTGTGPFPPALVAEAEDLYAWLMATAGPPVLLHGDLHHDNILAAERMPYLAIDPKGLVGEAAYEVGSWLRNWLPDLLAQPHPGAILARRVAQFAEELGFERARVRGWAVYQAVLSAWQDVEDFGQPSAAMLTCAELLAAIPA